MATRILPKWWERWFRGGTGQLIEGAKPDNKLKPGWATRMEDIARAVTYGDWKTIVSSCRRIYANLDVIKGAIAQKAMHSVGRAWAPVFVGKITPETKKWADAAKRWLETEWFPVCDVRGGVFDFRTGLYLDSVAFDRDGDNAVILTETPEGYPQIQRIPCHRIGQFGIASNIVGDEAETVTLDGDGGQSTAKGLYKGMRIEHGIIYNDYGRAVAIRHIGPFAMGTPQDISLRDADFRFDPEYVDQGRGFPTMSGSVNFLASTFLAHEYEQQALLLAGSIGLLEYNEMGAADTTDPSQVNSDALAATVAAKAPATETIFGGTTRYISSKNPGNKLEAFSAGARPSQQWVDFQDRIIRNALCGMNWPYSLVWKPESMTGTQERSAIEQARAAVKDRQDLLLPRARRIVGFAISKAMKLGILEPYPGEDAGGFLKWSFEMPPEFNIDHGREDESWMKLRQAGAATLKQRLDSNALGTPKEIYLQLCSEEADMQDAITETERARGIKIDPRSIRMLTPNDQPAPEPGAEPPPAAKPG